MVAHEYPPAGRELDRLVVERLFGVEMKPDKPSYRGEKPRYALYTPDGRRFNYVTYVRPTRLWDSISRYSTRPAAAWEVWRECIVRFGGVTIRADMEDYGREPGDICWVTVWLGGEADESGESLGITVFGDFPAAMCKAALLALDWQEQHAGKEE